MKNINRQKELLYSIQYKLLIYKQLQRNNVKYYSFDEICQELDINDEELIMFINTINETNNQEIPVLQQSNNKYKINHQKKSYTTHKFNLPKNKYNLCIISDKHIGHVNDRIRYVHDVYEEAEKRNVDLVFDLGDLLNGPIEMTNKESNVRIGDLENSLKEAQKFHQSKIPTYFITGNHDLAFMKINKCDIGRLLEQECKNLHFLNNLFAPIEVNGLRLNLSHGYTEQKHLRFVKLQKEQKFLSINNPHMIFQGHFHTHNFSEYNDIILYQIPSLRFGDEHLQIGTKSMKAHGNNIGAIFISVNETENEIDMRFDEMHFYENEKIKRVAEYTKRR